MGIFTLRNETISKLILLYKIVCTMCYTHVSYLTVTYSSINNSINSKFMQTCKPVGSESFFKLYTYINTIFATLHYLLWWS